MPDRRRLIVAAVLLGIGLGGFFDGIVLHQILQWHHMVSTPVPPTTVENLQLNTTGDGLFHAATWIVTLAGVFVLMASNGARGKPGGTRTLVGGMLVGWGCSTWWKGSSITTCSAFTTCARGPTSCCTTSLSLLGAP